MKPYRSESLTFNRLAVAASAATSKRKNTIHAITQVDISEPRRLMLQHHDQTGEKLSLTAYVVYCLGQTLKDYPEFNSFRKGKRLIVLKDLTVSVLVEKEYEGEKVPEPIGISKVQEKSISEISCELAEAKKQEGTKLGSMTGMTWVRLIPGWLLKAFFRIADRNIGLGVKYGKVSVTAVGMFAREAVWFVPHGTATVLVTVGGIEEKVIRLNDEFVAREHLCMTLSFDHDIVDGAPAARFVRDFSAILKTALTSDSGIINLEKTT